eukprot:gb/GECG01013398.1/.p1 GENE.gb/GECG01013398.1/~~gb/GECG01013398.1/.p1  ORF type:complete len:642 (+),score=72.70 gb/GECG01013398.1/:1-1926(+)
MARRKLVSSIRTAWTKGNIVPLPQVLEPLFATQRVMAANAHGAPGMSSQEGTATTEQHTPSAQLYGVSKTKEYKSAIVIIPPTQLWKPIQTIRSIHDRVYHRWMPHINLMYPFLPDEGTCFEQAAATLQERLRDLESFRVHLNEIQCFKHKKSATVWLGPGDDSEREKLEELNRALEEVFPEHNDVSTISDKGFTPHLSLGQFPPQSAHSSISVISEYFGSSDFSLGSSACVDTPSSVHFGRKQDSTLPSYTEESEQRLRSLESSKEITTKPPRDGLSAWRRLSFMVDHVHMISRKNYHDPFHIRASIPLGNTSGDSPNPDGARYVAWRSPNSHTNTNSKITLNASSVAEGKAGAEGKESGTSRAAAVLPAVNEQGYWNFAFGANMSRNKVEKSRKLKPLESVPGKLQGWRLSFSHRGGMGTIIPTAPEAALQWLQEAVKCDSELRGASVPEDLVREYMNNGSSVSRDVTLRLLESFPGSPDATVHSLLEEAPCVHGVLHKLPEEAYIELRRAENGYHEFELPIEAYDGRVIMAKTFVSRPGQELACGSLRPTQRYRDLLTSGDKDYGVDKEYISWIRKFPTVHPKERTREYYMNPEGPPKKIGPEWKPGDPAKHHETHSNNARKPQTRGNKRGRGRVQHF